MNAGLINRCERARLGALRIRFEGLALVSSGEISELYVDDATVDGQNPA